MSARIFALVCCPEERDIIRENLTEMEEGPAVIEGHATPDALAVLRKNGILFGRAIAKAKADPSLPVQRSVATLSDPARFRDSQSLQRDVKIDEWLSERKVVLLSRVPIELDGVELVEPYSLRKALDRTKEEFVIELQAGADLVAFLASLRAAKIEALEVSARLVRVALDAESDENPLLDESVVCKINPFVRAVLS